MQITFACGAMPFGPDTPSRRSLGGSETAALMLAKAVAARGHDVTMFCNLPPLGAPDYFQSGVQKDGVRYVSLQHYDTFVTTNEIDVLIAVRDPHLVAVPALARKKVLWMHDIATTRGMKRALEAMQFTFDEIWTVSEWHKAQVAEVTGYPEERIFALRNGIVAYNPHLTEMIVRSTKQILFAARPERGIDNLIRPGGIMEHLPEYKLLVCMYEHFPDHMRDYYNMIFARMEEMPNVEFIGGKPNEELRQIISESAAYIYPTQFEETSCILARECIEQLTPFLTTSVGALPETLGSCGIYFEDWLFENGIDEPERGGDGWCKLFAQFFRERMGDERWIDPAVDNMNQRTDLYWDGVAAMIEPRLAPPNATHYSRIYSLVQDGDVIPALEYIHEIEPEAPEGDETLAKLCNEIYERYAFVNGDIGKYYDDFYRMKGVTELSELRFTTETPSQRHAAIRDQIATLPPGAIVFEYGCGPGHVLAPLAKAFPDKKFVGYDFSAAAVDCVNEGAKEHGLKNLMALCDMPPGDKIKMFDAVICSEVLEHVVKPWELAETIEGFAKPGGKVIITVPFGPWEPESFEASADRWGERFHLWHIDRQMLREMLGPKQGEQLIALVLGQSPWLRPLGNLIYSYNADHNPTIPVDPFAKAMRHRCRETCAAAVIAYNNEDTILRMLNSLNRKVQYVQIAHGPSVDGTLARMLEWFAAHPWMAYKIIDVPKIEPGKFGFDDARNASVRGLEQNFDWILWIDTDEYLSGDFRKYLRPSSLDAYLISQHHFTVEPRGNPPEIDKPARLIRCDRHFRAMGRIHEHFEIIQNGEPQGPGRAMILPDVDIGHPGYVNEAVRQGRFQRNFPFLLWEHEEGGDRKLHKFLWFRDIIHRMRFTQNPNERVALAQDAVSYYNEWQVEMATFGPGMFMALQYLAEANTVLNRGVPLRVTVTMDDRQANLEGRFESYEQIEKVMRQLLIDEFKERTGRYY